MTNTKFRKRALLSSVAMLIVALIALSSATFAWFAANTQVSSSGLKMKTTAATGIVIASASALAQSASYGNSTFFDVGTGGWDATNKAYVAANIGQNTFNLQPATLEDTVIPSGAADYATFKFFTAAGPAASTKNSGAAQDAGTYTYDSGSSSYVYYEDLHIRVNDGAASGATTGIANATVSITLNDSNNDVVKNAIRVALVAVPDTTEATNKAELIGIWAPGSAQDASQNTLSGGNGSFIGTSAGTAVDFIASGSAAYATDKTMANTPLVVDGSGSDFVRVYVYLDGYDFNCYSNAVTNANALINSIDINFTKTAD